MSRQLLQSLLAGRWTDPDTGAAAEVQTRNVELAPSLDGQEAALVEAAALGQRLALVCDPETEAALGARVLARLQSNSAVTPIRLPSHPHPDMDTVHRVRALAEDCDGLISVGSGTITDLVKYAAHLEGKPFAAFATAPSMNGYTSVNAAITDGGHKKTLPATAARAVFMDLAVLANAPVRMIRAGVGDSLCRSTAQTDWLMAHFLVETPYRSAPFALLQDDENKLIEGLEGVVGGDLGDMEVLARTLVMSGFGMAICGGSYPASQGEHLISHALEMLADPDWDESLHGEQIAVTTLTMARLQEQVLATASPRVEATAVVEADLVPFFGADLAASCWREFSRKALDPAGAAALNVRLRQQWDACRTAVRQVRRTSAELEAALRRVGAPTTPGKIGIPDGFYRETVLHAREIRDRFTFLDLAAETGMLEAAVA